MGCPGGSDSKESVCNAGDPGSIPGSGRSPGEEMETHFSILAWRIPWTEEPGGLFPGGHKESDTIELLTHSIHIYIYTHMYMGFSVGSDSKQSAYNAQDLGLIPA